MVQGKGPARGSLPIRTASLMKALIRARAALDHKPPTHRTPAALLHNSGFLDKKKGSWLAFEGSLRGHPPGQRRHPEDQHDDVGGLQRLPPQLVHARRHQRCGARWQTVAAPAEGDGMGVGWAAMGANRFPPPPGPSQVALPQTGQRVREQKTGP